MTNATTTTTTKPAQTSRKPARTTRKPAAAPAGDVLQTAQAKPERWPVEKLHAHPANPKGARLNDTEIRKLADDIAAHGLQTPIRARRAPDHWGIPEGHLQIIYGERRWRALGLLGADALVVVEPDCTDARALALMALENGQRADLDPIAKAEQLRAATEPQADGSAPLTQAEAGALYGITQAEVSNLIRMLDLPAVIRDDVARGELPVANARQFVRYRSAPPAIMAALARDYRANRDDYRAESRDEVARMVDFEVREMTRPLDNREQLRVDGVGWCNRLFPLNDKTRALLGVVDFGGKMGERATNTAAWDDLQRAAFAKKTRKADGPAEKTAKPKPGENPTPAQAKAEAARRAQLDAQRRAALKELAATWAERLLRAHLAGRVGDAQAWRVAEVLPLLMAFCRDRFYKSPNWAPLLEWLAKPASGFSSRVHSQRDGHAIRAWLEMLADTKRTDDTAPAVVRAILWPVLPVKGQPTDPAWYLVETFPDLSAPVLTLPAELLDGLAGFLLAPERVTVADAWRAGAVRGTHEHKLVGQLLDKLRKAELRALGVELGVWATDGDVDANASAAGLAAAILTAHEEKPLPCPAIATRGTIGGKAKPAAATATAQAKPAAKRTPARKK